MPAPDIEGTSQEGALSMAERDAMRARGGPDGLFPEGGVDTYLSLDGDQIVVLEGDARELELPVWEPTGDPEVDAALGELDRINELETGEHAPLFDAIHRRLHGRLSGLGSTS
jgi:hypothetical protein